MSDAVAVAVANKKAFCLMEYLTQFKKFLRTNNGSDTYSLACTIVANFIAALSVQPCTHTHTHTHALLNTYFHIEENIDTLVVYGNCIMTVNDGTTPT